MLPFGIGTSRRPKLEVPRINEQGGLGGEPHHDEPVSDTMMSFCLKKSVATLGQSHAWVIFSFPASSGTDTLYGGTEILRADER